MLVRTFLAVSLSSLMFTSAIAENGVAQLDTLPENRAIPIENHALSQPQATTAPHQSNLASANNEVTDTVAAASEAAEDASSQSDNDTSVQTPDASPTTTASPTAQTTAPSASSPHPTTATPAAASPVPAPVASTAKVEWTLDALNNAEWTDGLQRGQLPVYAKAQVLLNRQHASPGAIDASTGMNTLKAVSAYQIMKGLSGAGVLNQETWNSLISSDHEPAFIEYTITAQDLKTPMSKSIPASAAEKAKLKGLHYTRLTEMFGERFHMDENFLKKINPNASFDKIGEKIIVANVRNSLPEDIHLIIAHKSAKQLYLFNSKNQMIAAFPATVGKDGTPSPKGDLKISNIAPNPWYSYNPKTFGLSEGKTYSVAPGPNNYVGNMWIGLSRPSFGIHGTPEPSNISKGTGSNGCVRLTNWDANNLAKYVKVGTVVKFLE